MGMHLHVVVPLVFPHPSNIFPLTRKWLVTDIDYNAGSRRKMSKPHFHFAICNTRRLFSTFPPLQQPKSRLNKNAILSKEKFLSHAHLQIRNVYWPPPPEKRSPYISVCLFIYNENMLILLIE